MELFLPAQNPQKKLFPQYRCTTVVSLVYGWFILGNFLYTHTAWRGITTWLPDNSVTHLIFEAETYHLHNWGCVRRFWQNPRPAVTPSLLFEKFCWNHFFTNIPYLFWKVTGSKWCVLFTSKSAHSASHSESHRFTSVSCEFTRPAFGCDFPKGNLTALCLV